MSESGDDWVRRAAPHVLAQARQDALRIAEERLRDRLVEALLQAVEHPRTVAEQPAPAPRSGGSALWVYGIVPADVPAPPPARGVDGAELELVRYGDVAALVSRVPRDRFGEDALKAQLEDIERLEALARAHDGVVGAALEAGDVVPFRLCTIYESPESLRSMLERDGAALASTLADVRGKTEWGVKAWFDARRAGAAEPVADPVSGADYLARKRERREAAETLGEAIDATVAEIHARLAERASAAVLSRPQDRRLSGRDEEMVLNGAYLLPRGDVQGFTTLVDDLGRQHRDAGLTLETSGPWPPYHFVEVPHA